MESCLYIAQSKEYSCETISGRQRLIPVTSEIKRAMMNFSGSQSSSSLSEKPFYNTFSITTLVREEVHSILKELTISDQFIRKEEIDDLIERCLKEKVTIVQDDDSKGACTSAWDLNQDIEVTVEMLNENDKNKLIVENFQILEQRITNLEEHISQLLQVIPKIKLATTKKFKINTEFIREELKQFMNKLETVQRGVKPPAAAEPSKSTKTSVAEIPPQKEKPNIPNPYDQLYYEQRENEFNMLNYKKSMFSFELNNRAYFNPNIKPKIETGSTKFQPKSRSIFLSCNE